jgi:hypothetical protein
MAIGTTFLEFILRLLRALGEPLERFRRGESRESATGDAGALAHLGSHIPHFRANIAVRPSTAQE